LARSEFEFPEISLGSCDGMQVLSLVRVETDA